MLEDESNTVPTLFLADDLSLPRAEERVDCRFKVSQTNPRDKKVRDIH